MDIIIVEDSETARYCLESILARGNDYRVIASVASVEEALVHVADHSPDMFILDLGLPGLSDDSAVKALKAASPDAEIMVYTINDRDEMVFAALKAGATGYLLKDAEPSQIIAAIEEISGGGAPMSYPIARKVLLEFQRKPVPQDLKDKLSPLSKRETEIIELMYQGDNLQDIANKLNFEINRAMNSPEIAEKMVNGGMVVAKESAQYFGDLIKHDYEKYGKLVRDIGFKPQ